MTVTTVHREKWKAFHTQALERVARVPGVARAAFAWGVPLTGNKWPADMEIPGRARILGAGRSRSASRPGRHAGLLRRDGHRDRRGPWVPARRRWRTRRGWRSSTPRFVRQHFAAGIPSARSSASPARDRLIEIVGVDRGHEDRGAASSAGPGALPAVLAEQGRSRSISWCAPPAIRCSSHRASADALRAIDPTSAVEHMTTMAEIRRESTAPRTSRCGCSSASRSWRRCSRRSGLYGVLSLSVGARTKEIAVRKAIGAQWHQVVGLVVSEGARLVAVGVCVGILGALLVGRLSSASSST